MMSTTMNHPDIRTSPPYRRRVVSGVCVALAAMAGAPIWVVRLLAILLLLWHPIAAIIAYIAFAAYIRHGRTPFAQRMSALRDRVAPQRAPDAPPPRMPPIDGLANRFAALDLRLARLEARASDPDHLLRRRFDRL